MHVPLLIAVAAGFAAKKFLSDDKHKVSTEIRVIDESEVPDWAKGKACVESSRHSK